MARRRRRRNEGSVFYSASEKAWVARVSLGVVNGKRHGRKIRRKTEAQARAELERLQRAYGNSSDPALGTLGRYLAEWLPTHALSVRESTAQSYATHIALWIDPLLGGIPLARLRPADVRRLVAEMQRKGKSPGYIHLVIRTLSAALHAAVNDRSIPDAATKGVKLPRIERAPVVALTDEAADAILEAVAGTWVERPVRVWLGTGLRRGEVIGLDQGDIAVGFVRVRVSKTYVRAVPCSEDAMLALREAVQAAPRGGKDEPVFWAPRRNRQGQRERMRGDSITHALPRILEDAGLGHLAPHALRHGAATLMLTHGHSIRTIAEQLGNSPAITARTYAHVVPEAQRAAVDSLNRVRRVR